MESDGEINAHNLSDASRFSLASYICAITDLIKCKHF